MKILRKQKSLLKNKNEELKKKNEWQVQSAFLIEMG